MGGCCCTHSYGSQSKDSISFRSQIANSFLKQSRLIELNPEGNLVDMEKTHDTKEDNIKFGLETHTN